MGTKANYRIIAIWGFLALAAIILIITGTSFAGNTSFSSENAQCGPLAQEAEDGNLHGAMQIAEENGIKYIGIFTPELHSLDGPHPDNRSDHCVTVPQSGTYALKTVVSADSDAQDSFWVVIDGKQYLWDTGFGAGFQETYVISRADNYARVEVELPAGQSVISFHQRETGAKLDKIELVPLSFVPEPTEESEDPGNIGPEIPGGSPICGDLYQEAEQATLFGQMQIGDRQNASGGKFIFVPESVGQSGKIDWDNRAEFCVSVPQDGTYQIKAAADAPNGNSDSMFVTVDGAPAAGYLWQPRKGNGFVEDIVHDRGKNDPQLITLSQGDHVINFHNREPNTMLDWIKVELVSASGNPVDPAPTSVPPTATSVPEQPTTVPPTTVPPTATPEDEDACGDLIVEAESGEIFGEFEIGQDRDASGGEFVYIPESVGNGSGNNIDEDNRVEYCVEIEEPGDYQIMAWARTPKYHLSDSFFVTVDGAPSKGMIWDVKNDEKFVNSYVNSRGQTDRVTVSLSEGEHTIAFHRREAETHLDRFELIKISDGQPTQPTATPVAPPATATPVATDEPNPTAVPPTPTEVPNGGYPVPNPTATNEPIEPTAVPPTATSVPPTATSVPPTATPVDMACSDSLMVEAEMAELKGVFEIGESNAASGNKYIYVPNSAGHAPNGRLDKQNSATICIDVPETSNYKLVGWTWAPDIKHDSFYVQIDGGPVSGYLWDIRTSKTFEMDELNDRGKSDPTTFYLEEGEHTITFYRRESGTLLDKIELVDVLGGGSPVDPTPTEEPTTVPPAPTQAPPTQEPTQVPPTPTEVAPTQVPPTPTEEAPGGYPNPQPTQEPTEVSPTAVPPTATPVPPEPTQEPGNGYPVPPQPTATPNTGSGDEIAGSLLNPVDISFSNTSWSGNPFDLVAVVTFTHHGTGLKRRTEMFYNDNNEWKARFTPDRTGKWTYSTQSSDSDLDGKTGSVQVANSSAKGFVKGSGDKWVWSRSGEAFTPQFVMLGELNDYHSDSGKLNRDLNNFMGDHGFNGVHIRGYCRWFLLETDRCNYIPANQRDPDIRTFEIVEKIVMETYARGGTTHIWMYGDNMRKHNPTDWGLNGTEDQRMQRYFAARLGAMPGWTMGYGYDVFEWANAGQIESWYNTIDSRMMYPHMMGARGNKNQIMQYTEVLSYSAYEQHRPDYNKYVETINDRPGKPSFSEDRFRTRPVPKPYKDYSIDEVRQGMYRSTMAGGVANIWGNLAGSEPGPGSITYPNKAELKRYFDFFDDRFSADVELCSNLTNGACLKRPTNQHYLLYKEGTSSIQLNLSGMSGSQPYIAMNTKTGQTVTGTFQAKQQTWNAPSQSDWVIAVGNW